MRVCLDSNVWVSGFVARGLCADLLRAALRQHGTAGFALLLPDDGLPIVSPRQMYITLLGIR